MCVPREIEEGYSSRPGKILDRVEVTVTEEEGATSWEFPKE